MQINRTQTRFIVQHLLQMCCTIVCRNCAHCSCVNNGFLSVDITHQVLPSAPSVFHLFHVPSVSYGDHPSATLLLPTSSLSFQFPMAFSSFSTPLPFLMVTSLAEMFALPLSTLSFPFPFFFSFQFSMPLYLPLSRFSFPFLFSF